MLVRRRLPDAAPEFSLACHAATGGNAFLLGELLAELVDQGATGTGDEAIRVAEFGSERVGIAVRRRLRLLSHDAGAVARGLAVLGPPAALSDVANLTELRPDTVVQAADALVAVSVLSADRVVAWLLILLLCASVTISIYDLYLLLAAIR